MRKAIVSIGTGPQERLLRLAATTFRPYARRHGYDVHLHTEALDASRPAPWSKIVALQRLQERYDVLLWLDADLMIVDGRHDIAAELEGEAFSGMVVHPLSGSETMPNSGVWVLRTGERCAAFLDEVWAQTDLVEHRWWENAAICRLLGYELDPVRPGAPTAWREATRFLDPRWNSIRDASARGAFIRHYPGFKVRTRAAFMLRDRLVARP